MNNIITIIAEPLRIMELILRKIGMNTNTCVTINETIVTFLAYSANTNRMFVTKENIVDWHKGTLQ